MKTGWSIKCWVEVKANSNYSFVDRFKCAVSGEDTEAEFLIVSKTNFKHRGNETDEQYHYNRKHTPQKYLKYWEKWDKLKTEKLEKIKRITKRYNL